MADEFASVSVCSKFTRSLRGARGDFFLVLFSSLAIFCMVFNFKKAVLSAVRIYFTQETFFGAKSFVG